ncbi:MAG TPA: hypothetical protein VFZ99_02635 [Terriglobales bacterium]
MNSHKAGNRPLLVLLASGLIGLCGASAQTTNPHSPAVTGPYPAQQPARQMPQPSNAPAPAMGQPQATTSQPVPGAALHPSEMPPSPPRLSFAGGALTVVANNSTLTDVLKAISNITGAKIEGLNGAGDRVYGQFGPAPPRAVLDTLLEGSHYDFIILSAVDNPQSVQQVILSPRANTPSGGAQTATAPVRAYPSVPAANNEENENSQEMGEEQQPEPPQPMPQAQPQPAPNGNAQQNGPKSPEQLLEELRRLNRVPDQSSRPIPPPPQ